MKRNLFLGFILLFFLIFQENNIQSKNLNFLIEPNIQDIIINNQVVKKGIRDCQRRYEVLKPILDLYKRPITVLELGACQGFYSFNIARDYDSTCVMIENNYDVPNLADNLLDLCIKNDSLNNLVLLNKKLSLPRITRLADCEHFDVVLAFDIVFEEDTNWHSMLSNILRLGDNIFVECPFASKSQTTKKLEKQNQTLSYGSTGSPRTSLFCNKKALTLEEYINKENGQLLLTTPSEIDSNIQEKLFWFNKPKTGLRCHHFDLEPKDSNFEFYKIESTYDHKCLLKKNHSRGPEWKSGINLVTFLMLNGTYPDKVFIKNSIIDCSKEHLADFTPWNLIVQGKKIMLIDQKNSDWKVNVQKSLDFIFEVINQKYNDGILRLFQEYKKWRVRKHK